MSGGVVNVLFYKWMSDVVDVCVVDDDLNGHDFF